MWTLAAMAAVAAATPNVTLFKRTHVSTDASATLDFVQTMLGFSLDLNASYHCLPSSPGSFDRTRTRELCAKRTLFMTLGSFSMHYFESHVTEDAPRIGVREWVQSWESSLDFSDDDWAWNEFTSQSVSFYVARDLEDFIRRFGAKASKAQLSRSPNYVGGLDDGASGSESGERSNSGAPGTENTVFCGGLPLEATPEALGWFFAHYGTVLSVKLIYDKLTGACKGYGFVVFADVAIAEMVKAQRQIPFLGKMIDVSEAMRHVGRHDDGRGFAPGAQYGTKRAMGYGSQGPFYPPQMSMYPPHMVMPPHMAMGGQNPHMAMMAMHHMQFAGYPMYANGATVYGMPGEHVEDVEEDSDEVAAEGETVAASE